MPQMKITCLRETRFARCWRFDVTIAGEVLSETISMTMPLPVRTPPACCASDAHRHRMTPEAYGL